MFNSIQGDPPSYTVGTDRVQTEAYSKEYSAVVLLWRQAEAAHVDAHGERDVEAKE